MSKLFIAGGLAQGERRLRRVADAGAEILGFDKNPSTMTAAHMLDDPLRVANEVAEADAVIAISASNTLLQPYEMQDYIALASPEPRSFSRLLGGAAIKTVNNAVTSFRNREVATGIGIASESAAELFKVSATTDLIRLCMRYSTSTDLIRRKLEAEDEITKLRAVIMSSDEFFPIESYSKAELRSMDIEVSVLPGGHDAVFMDPEPVFERLAHEREASA